MRDYTKFLDDDTIEKIIVTACVLIHGQAVRNCKVKTGLLRNSISWATTKESGGANSKPRAGAADWETVEKPTREHTGHVGTSVEYAAAVEFGLPDMPNYPMQPYLRPAVYQTGSNRERAYKEIIGKRMEEVVEK
jgi:hypothetical protein